MTAKEAFDLKDGETAIRLTSQNREIIYRSLLNEAKRIQKKMDDYVNDSVMFQINDEIFCKLTEQLGYIEGMLASFDNGDFNL